MQRKSQLTRQRTPQHRCCFRRYAKTLLSCSPLPPPRPQLATAPKLSSAPMPLPVPLPQQQLVSSSAIHHHCSTFHVYSTDTTTRHDSPTLAAVRVVVPCLATAYVPPWMSASEVRHKGQFCPCPHLLQQCLVPAACQFTPMVSFPSSTAAEVLAQRREVALVLGRLLPC